MKLSNFVTLVIIVPETHAQAVREAMGSAGVGKVGNYSHCSFSTKGIGRFLPNTQAKPFIGKTGILEEVIEERIEAICSKDILKSAIEAIRQAHPYEEPSIDIYPLYELS